MTRITTNVRPNGRHANYLACGIIEDGEFIRKGYPKHYPELKISRDYFDDDKNRHKASYEYGVSIEAPDTFPLYICRVGADSGNFEVLFAPEGRS